VTDRGRDLSVTNARLDALDTALMMRCIRTVYRMARAFRQRRPEPANASFWAYRKAHEIVYNSRLCQVPFTLLPPAQSRRTSISRRTILPIYAYRCASCGFEKDVLQKLSDPALTECPSCHASAFQKQVTAAGFQLKGSGWYATDFRNPPAAQKTAEGAAPKEAGAPANPSGADAGSSGPAKTPAAEGTSTPAAAPAASSTPTPSGSSPTS
jgi:putative FmdB family regulatory protein